LKGKAEVEVAHKVQMFSENLKEIYFETNVDIVKIYKSGDSFGELALLDNKPRAASIRCVEDCHFAVLEKANFQEILSQKP
jgi:CRP-like cAMP-binding protein